MLRIALVVLALGSMATAAAADRYAPYATQQAAVGCWDAGAGVTLVLRPFGKHTVDAVARFATRPRGGPAVIKSRSVWVEGDQAYEVLCRPQSQHGSFCRIRPVAGGLSIRVFAIHYGAPNQGTLVEDFVAKRCE
jgi:hypothetical protein